MSDSPAEPLRASLRSLRDWSRRDLLAGGLLAVLCVAAVLAGFFCLEPSEAGIWLMRGGYWILALALVLFLGSLAGVVLSRGSLSPRLSRSGLIVLALLALASVFVATGDERGYKVLMDEPILQATAFRLQESREVGTTAMAQHVGDSFVSTVVFLDKRPYLYAFLVSLLHDLCGAREDNAYLVNLLVLPLLVCSTYLVVRRLSGLGGSLLALALLCSLPLLSQTANGAGPELLNLALIALCSLFALGWLERPEPSRLSLLCLGAVLLAYCRYESALYCVAVVPVVLLGWLKAGRPVFSWGALASPLLLVPCAWLHRFVAANPELWELAPGQTRRFSPDYLLSNLEGAWRFFLNVSPALPNSPALSVLSVLAALLVLVPLAARRRATRAGGLRASGLTASPSPGLALTALGLAAFANLGLLQFYYWARLDDYLACRFSLPVSWFLLVFAACVLGRPEPSRRWPFPLAWLVVCAGLLLHALPVRTERAHTTRNLVAVEIDWERRFVEGLPVPRGALLVLSNRSALPWLMSRVSSIMIPTGVEQWLPVQARLRAEQPGLVLVTQSLRPTGPGGAPELRPSDALPSWVTTTTLAEFRLEGRVSRISRVDAVAPPGDPEGAGAQVPVHGGATAR